jgi:hypothetical protein
MPSSIDVPLSNAADYAVDSPMAFRRERYWFLSFMMTPFKDLDNRATEPAAPRQPGKRRSR